VPAHPPLVMAATVPLVEFGYTGLPPRALFGAHAHSAAVEGKRWLDAIPNTASQFGCRVDLPLAASHAQFCQDFPLRLSFSAVANSCTARTACVSEMCTNCTSPLAQMTSVSLSFRTCKPCPSQRARSKLLATPIVRQTTRRKPCSCQ